VSDFAQTGCSYADTLITISTPRRPPPPRPRACRWQSAPVKRRRAAAGTCCSHVVDVCLHWSAARAVLVGNLGWADQVKNNYGVWCLDPVFVESCDESAIVQVCPLSLRTMAGRDFTHRARRVPVGSLLRPVGNGPVDVTYSHAACCGADASLQALYSSGRPTTTRYLGLLPGSRGWVRVTLASENARTVIAAIPSVSPPLKLAPFPPSAFTRHEFLHVAGRDGASVLPAHFSRMLARGTLRSSNEARTGVTQRRRPATYVLVSLRAPPPPPRAHVYAHVIPFAHLYHAGSFPPWHGPGQRLRHVSSRIAGRGLPCAQLMRTTADRAGVLRPRVCRRTGTQTRTSAAAKSCTCCRASRSSARASMRRSNRSSSSRNVEVVARCSRATSLSG
jgi:hypothetical protein